MQTQQNVCDIKPNPQGGQLPQLGLVFGRCLGIVGQTVDWTTLKITDDSGEMPVYVQSSMINVSESLVDECLLLVGDSGKSQFGVDNLGNACIIINDAKDIWLRRPAYNEFRKRTGTDEQASAGHAATTQVQAAVQQHAQATTQVATDVMPVTEPVLPQTAPLAIKAQVKVALKAGDQGASPVTKLNPPYDLFGAAMLDCLETSTVVISEYVSRHPEHHGMLCPELIQKLGTSFFIQVSKAGAL